MFDTIELSLIGANMHAGYWSHNGWSWMGGFHWLNWALLIAVATAILITAFRLATRDMGADPRAYQPVRRQRRY